MTQEQIDEADELFELLFPDLLADADNCVLDVDYDCEE